MTREKIISQAEQFNWDIPALEQRGLFEIYVVDTDDIEKILATLKEKVQKMGAKRLVLDSLTTMMEHGIIYRSKISRDMSDLDREQSSKKFPQRGHEMTRKDVYYIIGQVNNLRTTALLVSEVAEKSNYLSRDTISEFASDGVILLQTNMLGGEQERLLSVKKMRGTQIDISLFPMKFTNDGITVEV